MRKSQVQTNDKQRDAHQLGVSDGKMCERRSRRSVRAYSPLAYFKFRNDDSRFLNGIAVIGITAKSEKRKAHK
jgi:hypothetical protein